MNVACRHMMRREGLKGSLETYRGVAASSADPPDGRPDRQHTRADIDDRAQLSPNLGPLFRDRFGPAAVLSRVVWVVQGDEGRVRCGRERGHGRVGDAVLAELDVGEDGEQFGRLVRCCCSLVLVHLL